METKHLQPVALFYNNVKFPLAFFFCLILNPETTQTANWGRIVCVIGTSCVTNDNALRHPRSQAHFSQNLKTVGTLFLCISIAAMVLASQVCLWIASVRARWKMSSSELKKSHFLKFCFLGIECWEKADGIEIELSLWCSWPTGIWPRIYSCSWRPRPSTTEAIVVDIQPAACRFRHRQIQKEAWPLGYG